MLSVCSSLLNSFSVISAGTLRILQLSVMGVMELVDLEVEKVDRAPKCRVVPISVHGLLIRFVVFLASHVGPTNEVPTLSV